MSRRVLIVVSSYAPAMIADMHRARHLAWTLPEIGWEVEILCPEGSYQQVSCMDEDSAPFFAAGTATHAVPGMLAWLFRALGFGSIGWRALLPMYFAGRRLLQERKFDLVYFSTTQFPLFLLGPAWKAVAGVPFALDLHDPCFKEDAALPVWARPGLKHSVSSWLARHVESTAVSAATGLVSVSPDYLAVLERRYARKAPGWLAPGRRAVIPFAVLQRDFDIVAEAEAKTAARVDRHPVRIVYVGAGGPVMERSFGILCDAVATLRAQDGGLLDAVQIELFGTMLGWRVGDPTLLADIAREHGLGDLVSEDPCRVSYRRSVALLLGAGGALVLGVDDAGYMPSKLFSYALSGRPLLAVLREDGAAFAQLRATPGIGHVIGFDESGAVDANAAAQALRAFMNEVVARLEFERRSLLIEHLAPVMAGRHAALFEACLIEG